MKERYVYPAVLNYAEDGISVSFPDLPGCLTCADDAETAFKRAKEAMGLWLYDSEQCGEPIPKPSDISSIALEKGDVPTIVEVFMPPIRERAKNKVVKKTLTIPAWLNAVALEHHVNFSQVLQDAIKAQLHLG